MQVLQQKAPSPSLSQDHQYFSSSSYTQDTGLNAEITKMDKEKISKENKKSLLASCPQMMFQRFLELGRVACVSFGPLAGKLVTIIDGIDQNRALMDEPCTHVRRQATPF